MRGMAIVWVILYHVFSRWASLLPHGSAWADVALFKYGGYGVQLFFLISGYVIYQSLDSSRHVTEFLFRRWKRLFPAMLLCSLLIFAVSGLWTVKTNPLLDASSLLPGISLVAPGVWSWLTGHEFQMLEGSFWSMFVEVKFYLLAAFAYFVLGRQWLLPLLCASHVGYWGLNSLLSHGYLLQGWGAGVLSVMGALSLDYFGWFAIGAAIYEYRRTGRQVWLSTALVMLALVCVMGKLSNPLDMQVSLLTGLLFVGGCLFPALAKLFAARPLVWLGAVSYPLYLLHENASVSMTNEIVRALPSIPPLLALALSLGVIVGVAVLVARVYEPKARRKLDSLIGDRLCG
jgi:peptidoglycan/LPS O-acetylase OafA/YrhL